MSTGVAVILAAIGVACAAYGLRFVFSETKMRFHLVWLALAVALIAPAALVATGLWDSVPAALRWVPAAALAAFAAYELLVGAAVGLHFNDKAAPGLDYVIVLGAQVLHGKPGRTFAVRLDAALAYLSENPRCRCVVCGAQGPNESIPEADAGCNYLVEHGIDRERILLEANSYNTAQNLHAAADDDTGTDDTGTVLLSSFCTHDTGTVLLSSSPLLSHTDALPQHAETSRPEFSAKITFPTYPCPETIDLPMS